MSLAKTLNKGKQKTKIHINDIRENPDNYYDFKQEEIAALANSILEHGQIHNGLVYEETGSDGKHYTLLSGAKRYRAISLLYNSNTEDKIVHDGYMDVLVQEKPKNKYVMKDVIGDANLQRRPTHETLYKEIKEKEEFYDYLVSIGKRPEQNKREYIGSALGITGRQVTNIKNKYEGKSEKTKNIEKSSRQEYNKKFAKEIKKKYQFNTTVTAKSITFKCDNTEELNEFLKYVGINLKYDFIKGEEE